MSSLLLSLSLDADADDDELLLSLGGLGSRLAPLPPPQSSPGSSAQQQQLHPAAPSEEEATLAAQAAGVLGAQLLTSVQNDPRSAGDGAAGLLDGAYGVLSLLTGGASDPAAAVPPLPPGLLPDVSAADFEARGRGARAALLRCQL